MADREARPVKRRQLRLVVCIALSAVGCTTGGGAAGSPRAFDVVMDVRHQVVGHVLDRTGLVTGVEAIDAADAELGRELVRVDSAIGGWALDFRWQGGGCWPDPIAEIIGSASSLSITLRPDESRSVYPCKLYASPYGFRLRMAQLIDERHVFVGIQE